MEYWNAGKEGARTRRKENGSTTKAGKDERRKRESLARLSRKLAGARRAGLEPWSPSAPPEAGKPQKSEKNMKVVEIVETVRRAPPNENRPAAGRDDGFRLSRKPPGQTKNS
jgi:hypothetical protein